ncbi:MAG: acylphosphatase [Desulfobulbus sp.]|jgi:acylphosphatase|uniref:acylphosphatase n=1 Tax=Desulfobulbus sp. TaxID=895 RepID=UPI00284D1D2D|nr:acylphosphatase [Desulfobulbus sp.]MDR2550602.1 acylphosphatase [Desulfobulbus sp.]
MSRKRIRATVHGRVQRVAFRECTRQEANQLGVSGWVRNQSDGTVLVLCEGEASQVDALLAWLSIGSPYAMVTKVDWHEEEPLGEAGPLVIRYGA